MASSSSTTRTLWETSEVTRAAKAVGQSPLMVLTHRIRQQAGSHRSEVGQDMRDGLELVNDADSVGDVRGYEGSESGVSVTGDVADPPHSPASRLPPI